MLQLVINRNLKTQEQRNVAEMIECFMMNKEDQFEKFMDVQMNYTSDRNWSGKIYLYKEGSYIVMEGCKCGLKGFINNNNDSVRKPIDSKLTLIETFDISGNYTEIQTVH